MLQRVWEIAQAAAAERAGIQVVVATEDERIAEFCQTQQMAVCLTDTACRSGTERAAQVMRQWRPSDMQDDAHIPFDFVINLQGDNPLCPPWFVRALIDAFLQSAQQPPAVISAFARLNWSELDQLRQVKQQTPFSGTTVVMDAQQRALWFSKQILPAIRNEAQLRLDQPEHSPVCRHIGLYGYSQATLLQLSTMPEGLYEPYEGLEQLAFIEQGLPIQMVEVDYQGRGGMSGVDAPSDVKWAEYLLARDGEFTDVL